jgi:tetratricopeptide (TPR) repeat protein
MKIKKTAVLWLAVTTFFVVSGCASRSGSVAWRTQAKNGTLSVGINPDFIVSTYNNKGIAHFNRGEYDQAIEQFTLAIEIKPNAALYANRAGAYFMIKEYDKAIADHTKAIDMDPDNVEAYEGRGFAYFQAGEYAPAAADFEKVLQFNSDNDIREIREELRQMGY